MSHILHVRNFLRLKSVDLPLGGIMLVAGRNSQGKTSLLDALACAFLQTHRARGVTTKKDAAILIHDEETEGTVVLEETSTGATTTLRLPDATIETAGPAPHVPTSLAIGASRLMSLSPDQRSKEIGERWNLLPTREELAGWLERARGTKPSEALMKALWDRIERDGWDNTYKYAAEQTTKLRGQWEAVTGQNYGSKKAEDYLPEGLLAGESYDLEAEEKTLTAATETLEVLLRGAGMNAERRNILREKVKAGEVAEKKRAELDAEENVNATELDAALQEASNLPTVEEAPGTVKCPHCARPVRFSMARSAGAEIYTMLEKAPPPPSADEKEATVKRARELEVNISALRQRMRDIATERNAAAKAVAEARDAKQALSQAESLPDADEEGVARARAAKLVAERRVLAIQKKEQADKLQVRITGSRHTVNALASTGARAEAAEKMMGTINARLAELSALAGFEPVQLSRSYDATLGGRTYLLNGESGRWRVDLILSALFCEQEDAPILLVDRLDVLEPQGRTAVVGKLAKALARPVVITMMAKDRDAAPDLARANIGKTYWIENGNLKG